MINEATSKFIQEHRHDDIHRIAFKPVNNKGAGLHVAFHTFFGNRFTAVKKKFAAANLVLLACLMQPATLAAGKEHIVYEHINSADGLGNDHVLHISQLKDRRMLIITHRTVNIFDGSRFRIINRDDEKVFPIPHYTNGYQIYLDQAECLWIKEWGRLWCVNLKTGTLTDDYEKLFHSTTKGIVASDIKDLFFDTTQTIWFLTDSTLQNSERTCTIHLGLTAEHTTDLIVHQDKIFLLQSDGSIKMADKTSQQVTQHIPSPLGMNADIWGINTFVTPKGTIYCIFSGSTSYLYAFDTGTLQWERLLESQMVLYGAFPLDNHHIGITSRHGIIEVGIPECGLPAAPSSYSLGSPNKMPNAVRPFCNATFYSTFKTHEQTYTDFAINHFCRDHQGGLWIATDVLGMLYNHHKRNRFVSGNSSKSLGINDYEAGKLHKRLVNLYDANKQYDHDFLIDQDGISWYATHRGIRLHHQDTSRWLTIEDGLPGNHIASLTLDRNGHIWAATNHGIAEIIKKPDGHYSILRYGSDDGVPRWSFLYSSSLLLSDGRIAIQAQQGWITFHPDSVKRDILPMQPCCVGIAVNGTDSITDTVHRIRLPYTKNNVEIFFTTLNYAFPQQVTYHWRINNGEWNQGMPQTDKKGVLHLSLLQLTDGIYNIEVKATYDGHDFSPVSQFSLIIMPPWWKTWWAYTLYFIAILSAIIFISFLYIAHQRQILEWKRQEEVLQLQIRHLLEQVTPAFSTEGTELPDGALTDRIPPEDEFIQRVTALIEQHLGDTYTVEQLARDLCMERTGLYKRLTSIINQTPQRFIRSIRIRRACDLLSTTELPITEICYRVGFSSSSYMSRCFIEDLGCKPSEWREKNL